MDDHYEILGVLPTASPEVIDVAYRAQARRYHPDTGTDPDEEWMKQINLAAKVLRDPESRATYDAKLAAARAGESPGPSAPAEPLGDEGWGEGDEPGDRDSFLDDLGRAWAPTEPEPEPDDDVAPEPPPRTRTGPRPPGRVRLALSAGLAKLLERALLNVTVGVVATAAAGWLVVSGPGVWSSFVDLLPWTEPSRHIATLEGHDDRVGSLAFSPDGDILVTGGDDSTVRLWDPESHELLEMLDHDAPVGGVAFSPGGDILASAAGREVRLWDPADWEQVGILDHRELLRDVENGEVLALAFSPDGRNLATSSGMMVLWDVATGEQLTTPPPWRYSTMPLVFSPDGALLTSPALGTDLDLWDAETLDLVATLEHADPVTALAISPRGDLLVTAGLSEHVTLWDAETYERVTRLEYESSPAPWVTALAFSPDGSLLAAAGGDHHVKLWNTETLRAAGSFSAERTGEGLEAVTGNRVHALAFSPDGSLLVSSDGSGRVVLWDVDG